MSCKLKGFFVGYVLKQQEKVLLQRKFSVRNNWNLIAVKEYATTAIFKQLQYKQLKQYKQLNAQTNNKDNTM